MSTLNFCNTKEQLNHWGEVVTGKTNGSPSGADIKTSTLPYTGQVRNTLPALEELYLGEINEFIQESDQVITDKTAELDAAVDSFIQESDQVITDKTAEFDASIANKEAEADAVIDSYRLLNKGPYSSGIELEDKFQYITYNGESYFATNPPYTTTTTTPDNDTGNLFIGGYVNEYFATQIAETVLEENISTYTDIVYKESGGNSAVENMIAGVPLAIDVGGTCQCENGTTFKKVGNATGGIEDYTAVSDVFVTDLGVVGDGVKDDSAAFDLSLRVARSSNQKLIGHPSLNIYLTQLPSPILNSDFYADMRGSEFLCNIASATRGDAIFRIEGSESDVSTNLSSDSHGNIFPVVDSSIFSVGDYVVGKYSVNQVITETPSNTLAYEIVGQISKIDGNNISLTHSSAYPRLASPPSGGVFKITKVNMNTGATIKNFTRRDVDGSSSDFQAISAYLAAKYEIKNTTSIKASGSHFVCYFSTDFETVNSKTIEPQETGPGRGYCEQYICCSNATVTRPQGILCRHTVDFSAGSTNIKCIDGLAVDNIGAAFLNHGSWESHLDYIDCSVIDGEGFSISRNGAEFGSHASNVRFINPSTYGCNYSILGLSDTGPTRNKQISIVNPKFIGQSTSFSYAVGLNMDGHEISGGIVEGGIRIVPTQTDSSFGHGYSNMHIKGTKITGSIGDNNAIQMFNMLENVTLTLSSCEVLGSIEQASTNFSVQIEGGAIRLSSGGLYRKNDPSRYAKLFSVKDALIELPANFAVVDNFNTVGHYVFKDNILSPEAGNASYKVNMTTSSGGIVEIVGNTAACSFDVISDSGRITCMNNTDHQSVSYTLPLLSVSGENGRLIFTGNQLVDSGLTSRLVVDPETTGLQLALSNNIHSQPFTFSGVTFRGGTVVGNSLLSGVQVIPSSIPVVPDVNFGYSN